MKTLEKTMTEFVLENNQEPYVDGTKYKDIVYYAKLLSTPLTLGMFIPCDEDGNVLDKPCGYNNFLEYDSNDFLNAEECQEYQKALSNVLFEGFEINEHKECISLKEDYAICIDIYDLENMTIESLIPYKLKLIDNFKL